MNNKPCVSIIIPVYNAEEYLRQCLDSVVNQTLDNYEVVIVNDGSKDGSDSILKEKEKKYPYINLIEQENSGVIAARIKGYENAVGEYIGWVDADDFCELNMFEKLYEAAKENNADVASCNYSFYPKGTYKEKWFKEYNGVVDWNFIDRNTVQWNKIVRKKLLDEIDIIKLFNEVGEGCYVNVLLKAKGIVTINSCLYNYRVGHTSTSTNWTKYEWYIKNIDKNMNQYHLIANDRSNKQMMPYFKYRLYYSIIIALIVFSYNNKKELYDKYKKLLRSKGLAKNPMNKIVLDVNYSKPKSMFLRIIVPNSYGLTRGAARIMLK